jgi:hypothetical protein
MIKMFSTIILSGLAAASAGYAQSSQPIQAKVPFAFTVRYTILAPGNYQLTYNSAHVLSIQGLDRSSTGAFVGAIPTGASEASASPSLVFECHANSCYLARVRQGGITGGRDLQVPHLAPEHGLAFQQRVLSITIPAK